MARSLQIGCSFALAMLLAAPLVALGQTPEQDEQARVDFFEKKIRPLLAENCYNCHSADTNARGGLRVDDRNGLLLGGDKGPAIVPGDPDGSLLVQAVRHTHGKLKMPPSKQLSDAQIADLVQWINDGVAWPRVQVPDSLGKPDPADEQLRKEHWAWQPLTEPAVPDVSDASWARDPIDRFVLARLEAKGLKPVGDANPLTLIRRLTFDLTGLPPTPEDVEAFVTAWHQATAGRQGDAESDAPREVLEKLVDRLLASEAYGQRWGRHWLDVARYGESTGSARNVPYPHAWRYRDYVIDALNGDLPYDQFLCEQIAGDLLPPTSRHDEQLVATGFLALGVKDVNQRFKIRFIMDNVDEQIDAVSRAVLALTVTCARCHDHKFDPIPSTDYYALAGIFCSSDLCAGLRNKMGGGGMDYYDTSLLMKLDPFEEAQQAVAEKIEQTKEALGQAKAELAALRKAPKQAPSDTEQANADPSQAKPDPEEEKPKPEEAKPDPEQEKKREAARKEIDQEIKELQNELVALKDPAASGAVALGVRDGKVIGDTEIRIRGQAEKIGPTVPRGFLTVFDVPDARPVNPKQSGRLELAQWLTSDRNPLTPRVMVNRIWQHLFGRGLVSSVDNFGVTGDLPSHPELLDHLATRFIKEGWSIKKLVRAIVLSRTYQLSADATEAHLAADPANVLLWRHSPRRLDAEEIRDAMLAAAGNLDSNRGQGSPAMDFKVKELRNNGAEAKRLQEDALKCKHRSIYLPLLRGLTPRSLEVFDFAEQGMVTGHRDTTTVATQALYLLNDPLVRQQSQVLAERVLKEDDQDDAGRIGLAYRLALGRPASADEVERATSYLAQYAAEADQSPESSAQQPSAAWTSLCHALLASAEFRYIR